MDKEKVIKGLECCSIPQGHCGKCPYETEDSITECTSELAKDAIALLKEQKAKTVDIFYNNGSCKDGKCPTCHMVVSDTLYPKYCGYCGQKLNWND